MAQTEFKIGDRSRLEELLTQCRKAIDSAMHRVDELDPSQHDQQLKEQLNSLAIAVEAMQGKVGRARTTREWVWVVPKDGYDARQNRRT